MGLDPHLWEKMLSGKKNMGGWASVHEDPIMKVWIPFLKKHGIRYNEQILLACYHSLKNTDCI